MNPACKEYQHLHRHVLSSPYIIGAATGLLNNLINLAKFKTNTDATALMLARKQSHKK